jgi:hypothetical protein
MTNRGLPINTDQTLPLLGLFLMLMVAQLANHGFSAEQTSAGGLSGFLARRTIDGIAVIGWLADHLLNPATNGGM